MNSEKFMKKPTVNDCSVPFELTDDELIQIYNALGFTMTSLGMCNGLLQDCNVLSLTEDNNRFINSIRVKIESELTRRDLEN